MTSVISILFASVSFERNECRSYLFFQGLHGLTGADGSPGLPGSPVSMTCYHFS